MKKKFGFISVCFLCAVCLFACGNAERTAAPVTSSSAQTVKDVLDAAKFLGIETSSEDVEDTSLTGEPDPNVDVDLTVMSSTMVYSIVYSMVTDPSSYEGKKVKIDGIFDVYTDDKTGKNYYACIIQDATKCCSSGIEFELEEERVYPNDYPDNGSYITVTGVFETYEEDGILYCTLRNAKMM
ncbi:MAG: hypothetical protein J6X36_03240 [Lachnospiraceae bacterium]|nr:hypothetical protein [Lachnospiraceae bacterium]